ncbi:NUDIX hydrolase [Limobrevibacterium gyesilva]|uniref:NUDIX hydrolase n=1 Tax=Limobrevibacterium gyesilva TaxID=2991712 RepID=A0AA41YQ12_9PROT|nr:NUDIX hydrolase [Limobrevibacterium gyesilva]MCW3476158.1 NUDIX hydrolase [Limobrevibacterium gyesilva]
MDEPDWLVWAREIQAIAQIGLTFNTAGFDHERYLSLQALAARMMAARGGAGPAQVEALFAGQTGYATPKTDVRGAVFRDGAILLVREAADGGRWTLPGGWADVNLTPAENVVKEVREESGFEVRVRKLAAAWDRTRQGHTPQPFSAYKLFFICDIVGGAAATSAETTEVAFFAEDALPDDLSHDRILLHQISRMFEHARRPELPADFE